MILEAEIKTECVSQNRGITWLHDPEWRRAEEHVQYAMEADILEVCSLFLSWLVTIISNAHYNPVDLGWVEFVSSGKKSEQVQEKWTLLLLKSFPKHFI